LPQNIRPELGAVNLLSGGSEAWELSTEPLMIRCPFHYALADMEADPHCQASLVVSPSRHPLTRLEAGCPTFRLLVRGSWGALVLVSTFHPKNKRAGILGSGLAHLKLVAGVRFELTTFGL
jgi:hypothetical protein